jgi:hypothetical protein
MSVSQEFQSGEVSWEILFIFIAGAIGDIAIHAIAELTKGTDYAIAQGLLEYYKSLGDKLLVFDTSSWNSRNKMISGTLQGAVWGGIACVIALLMAKLFLYAKEELENK